MCGAGQLSVRDGAVPGTESQTSVKLVGFEDEGSEVLEAVIRDVAELGRDNLIEDLL
jgi:hypothetical protein